jgi:hypothetical protein
MKQLLLAVVMLGGIAWGQESSPTPPPKGYIRVWSSGDLTCLTYEDARVSCGRGSIEGFIPLTVKRPHCWTKEGTALGVECSKHVWQKADAVNQLQSELAALRKEVEELKKQVKELEFRRSCDSVKDGERCSSYTITKPLTPHR